MVQIICQRCGTKAEAWIFSQKFCTKDCRDKAGWERNRPIVRRRAMILRNEMIRAYGRKCACCGEDNHWFLNLDHIENSSRVHTISIKEWQRLKDLGWPKDGFQLLCYNCNFAKRSYGECPHGWSAGG